MHPYRSGSVLWMATLWRMAKTPDPRRHTLREMDDSSLYDLRDRFGSATRKYIGTNVRRCYAVVLRRVHRNHPVCLACLAMGNSRHYRGHNKPRKRRQKARVLADRTQSRYRLLVVRNNER